MTDATGDGGGSLVVGSYRTAFRASDSWLFKSYAAVSALLAVILFVVLLLALPVWVYRTIGQSETATLSRAFLLVIGLFVLAPLVAPVVYAGRRHRQGRSRPRDDLLFGLSGFVFVLSLYVSLLVSAPPDAREAPPALVAPVVDALYALPPLAGLVPPLVAAALILAVERLGR